MPSRPPVEWVRGWRPALAGVTEVFHARFITHRYPPHQHDRWALIVVDRGAIRYALDRRHRGCDHTTVSVLPPGVVHDGQAATESGFTKRVAYLDTSVLPVSLAGRSVDRSEVLDPSLRTMISSLHDSFEAGEEAIWGEERLAWIARRLRSHLSGIEAPTRPANRPDAHKLREFLAAGAFGPITLEGAAGALGRSIGHLSRSFRSEFAISPYVFVTGLRVERARRLLLDGWSPADAAVAAGFYDQSHLHRHFQRHLGTTPGHFARPGPGAP